MTKRCFLLCFTLLLISVSLFPEDYENEIYRIRDVSFDIKGKTKSFAILIITEIKTGDILNGKEKLEEYIADKEHLLLNKRIFSTASIEYNIDRENETINEDDTATMRREVNTKTAIPVDLIVHTVDSGNFMLFPEPKYSSDSGLELSLKAIHYNFLGTGSPLEAKFGYLDLLSDIGEFSKQSITAGMESNIPFIAAGLIWNVKFDNTLNYFFDEPLSYKNTTGISVNIPVLSSKITAGFDQKTSIHEPYDFDDEKILNKSNVKDLIFFSSVLFAKWKIPTGIELKFLGPLVYTPSVASTFNYGAPNQDFGIHTGTILDLSHTLGFDSINWQGNFRKGFRITAENNNFYHFSFSEWNIDLALTAIGHFQITDFFAISSRLKFEQWFDKDGKVEILTRFKAGEMLRGVSNKSINADNILSLNLNFYFLVLKFRTDYVFNLLKFKSTEKFNAYNFRYINFDLHIGPIFDFAFIKGSVINKYRNTILPLDWNFFATAGLEIIFLPEAFRSIYLRFSFGWNLNSAFEPYSTVFSSDPEIFMGLGAYF
ncbi:hypothetical protein FACS1894190_10490 [Spirochaetia bacterium]|nr:hypothetical protein FACS1894190_10490 [Spirochaetia bacterium]